MGRTTRTSLKVKGYYIFPLLLRKVSDNPEKDFRGIVIRISNKKQSPIDIECYTDSSPRIRICSRPDFWYTEKDKNSLTNGKITGGYSASTIEMLNRCLHKIQSDVAAYIESNDSISKPLVMSNLYGSDFATTVKRRRQKYVTIPVSYHRRIIDSYDLTTKEIKELLDPVLEKRTFINSDGKPKTVDGVFDSETGENMIESEDDVFDLIDSQKSQQDRHKESERLRQELLNRSTEERYKLGQYNKNDICEVFALSYYDPKITNDYYPKIVVRLFEYKERNRGTVTTHVKDFNLEWIRNYFTWFEDNGYYRINTKGFDPLRYDPKIFFKITDPKLRIPYKGKSVEKNVIMFKSITRKLHKKGLLPVVPDLEEFTFEEITKKKSRKGTRKELALSKDEFDTIFHHRVLKENLGSYQKIFSKVFPKHKKLITVKQLEFARDMFITQVMAGGLRGWHDLKTCVVRKHSKKLRKITFRVGKKDDALENPANVYIEAVCKRNNSSLPFIDNEDLYAALIRTVVMYIGQTVKDFDREVKPDKYVDVYEPVFKIFRHGYFARKTFAQILRKLGVVPDDIELFTGHEKEDREITASYLDDNTVDEKAKLIKNLKIGKGLK